ncbi:MAG: Deoxyribodipyrimidine photo-lyase [Chthoniobacteraceae bacterium]|nr:Deoxyribodipyrimidine photo-lyase [Chthoniobacteraceae bacterium]
MSVVIHWFRRDFRLNDNTALYAARATGNQVVPVYILSTWKKEHAWTGAPRQEFLCGSLRALAGGLKEKGGRLLIRQGAADLELEKLARESGATAIYFNRDPDPFGRAMELKVEQMAIRLGLKVHACKDAAIHERDEVQTKSRTPFRVFTPYSKAWLKLDKPAPGPAIERLSTPENLSSLELPTLATWDLEKPATIIIIEPGEPAARRRLQQFLDGPVFQYPERRDLPAEGGTSRLSQDLRFGLLSIREIYARCGEQALNTTADRRRSIAVFINELIWREFYMQVLWHFPQVLDHEFQEKYRGMTWGESAENFDRWCAGMTGFPIVDAGLRQMLGSGFMHNRVRMIVAMFLVKDLHLSWKAGEKWFMQHLVDGEIASNNGGWQWSSGTGTDAAPYFRIQNPWSQSRRFDPEGAYIKRWVPELRDVAPARLYAPPASGIALAKNYPLPIVDHSKERDVTLDMYRR